MLVETEFCGQKRYTVYCQESRNMKNSSHRNQLYVGQCDNLCHQPVEKYAELW